MTQGQCVSAGPVAELHDLVEFAVDEAEGLVVFGGVDGDDAQRLLRFGRIASRHISCFPSQKFETSGEGGVDLLGLVPQCEPFPSHHAECILGRYDLFEEIWRITTLHDIALLLPGRDAAGCLTPSIHSRTPWVKKIAVTILIKDK